MLSERAPPRVLIPVEPRDTDLLALCRQIIAELEGAHPGCRIVLESTGDLAGVWDVDRLAQALSNLAGNAVQHGAPDAPVHVRIDGTAPGTVAITLRNQGTIPAEILPVIFDPFRGSGARRAHGQGLGLGLYISQQIVLAHRGQIEVVSDGETVVTVTLPRLCTRPA